MPEAMPLVVLGLLGVFIALPACDAWRRRRRSLAVRAAAVELERFADRVRCEARYLPLEEPLRVWLRKLNIEESASFELAVDTPGVDPQVLADAARRLVLRLRRRVAFDRKMLARTAPGLRRGAVAAALPPLIVIAFAGGGQIPFAAVGALASVEIVGCVLLWRLSWVEI
jgi:hypothetical protein